MINSTFGSFNVAFSALQASQMRLSLVGQNLANMNTVGYTRQQLDTVSLHSATAISSYMNTNSASIGFGVGITGVSQIRDPYLDIQYRNQMTAANYSNAMQTSLDSLEGILDESSMKGLRQAFADIQSTLTTMQDPSNALNDAYEVELRNRMKALTDLFNEASRKIDAAAEAEYSRLDGENTSMNGAEQTVNSLLQQIGQLNRQIKQNEVVGQNCLELRDTRNTLLDELSGYLPIEVSYFLDSDHDGIDANGNEKPGEKYNLDGSGNIIGKKEWPEDLRVELVYREANGDPKRLTLINGTEGKGNENYGQISIDKNDSVYETSLKVTGATSAGGPNGPQTLPGDSQPLSGGSIQASLNMLRQDGTQANGFIRGYQYYKNQLDTLTKTFADEINRINSQDQAAPQNLLSGDSAAAIKVNDEWAAGTVSITGGKDGVTSNILDMLQAMTDKYDILGGNSFSGFANHVSTTLASDSNANQDSISSQVTALNGIQNSRDSISGVSMDEEAANMMMYMSAYNAASRVMTTLDEMLDRLINNTGVVGR